MAASGDNLCTCGAGRWATWHASNCPLTRETLPCSYDADLHCGVHGHFAAQDDICICLHHSIDHDDDNVCSWEDCPCTDYRSRMSLPQRSDGGRDMTRMYAQGYYADREDEDHDGGRIGCNHAGDICSERPWSMAHRELVAQVLLGWAKEIVNHETSRDPYNVADEIAAIPADL